MSHRRQGGEEFGLRIRAWADDDAPPINRLRMVLKGLLRAHGVRRTSVRDGTPALPALAGPAPADDEAAAPVEVVSEAAPATADG